MYLVHMLQQLYLSEHVRLTLPQSMPLVLNSIFLVKHDHDSENEQQNYPTIPNIISIHKNQQKQ